MHWKVAIVFNESDERPSFHGETAEISVEGASILTDHNIFTHNPVTLLLAIPPMHPGQRQKVIEIDARIMYTVHSSQHGRFRIGIHFHAFKDEGKAFLDRNLKQRAMALHT